MTVDDAGLTVACGEASVRVQDVHPAGKRRQRGMEWVRGRGAAVGGKFE